MILTREEALVLTLLVSIGGTSFDAPAGMGVTLKERFEKQFDLTINTEDIVNIINKVKNLTLPSGSEDVIVE